MKVLNSNLHLQDLNNIFSQAPVNIRIIRAEDYIIDFANEYYLNVVGKNKDIIGKPLFEIFPELVIQGIKPIIDQVFETGTPYFGKEFPVDIFKHNTSKKHYFNFAYTPLREADGTIAKLMLVSTDVTDQVNYQIKSQEAEHLYHELIYSSPSMMAVLKGESMLIDIANDAILESWGKGRDVFNKSLFDVLPETIEQGFDKLLLEVFRTGIPFFAYEQGVDLVRHGQLETVFYNFVYQPQRNVNGKIEGVAVIANEVTKEALLHQKIEQNEYRFRNLVENSPYPICILKGEEMILEIANEAALEVWNVGKDAIGKPLLEISPELKDQPFMDYLLEVLHKGLTKFGNEQPVQLKGKDGNIRTCYLNFVYQPFYEDDGIRSGVVAISTDVTGQVISRKKIEESEARFRMIAEMMPEKVTNATPEGKVIFYNKSWSDYTGASFDELMKEGWGKWIHPDELQEVHDSWNHSVKTGDDFDMELRMLNQQGKYRWHNSKARAVKDDEGKIKLWVGTNADIHEQKQQTIELEKAVAKRTAELQKKNKELQKKNNEITETREKLLSEYSRSLIEASLDPLFVICLKGKITDVNQAAIKVTGIMRQKLTGTDFYDYFTDPEKSRKIYKEVFLKGFVADYPLTIKDHVLTDVFFNGSVYKDEKGNVLGAVVVARDITEIKKVEKQLLVAKEAAENAQKVAESASKSKQQFLSNMSHEIRTPMNAIIGFTKVMLKTELTKKQREYLSAIDLSGDALIVLINDILDLAKVEAGKMTFEQIPFKLSSSISSMMHLFEPKLQEKNIKLIKEYDKRIPEVLLGDSVRLNQVMLNLLSNAVKFTSAGKITVSVHLLEEDDKKVTVEFSIKDTGVGIKRENLETIFGSFQQAADETTRLYGGTGLGLSIVKQLLEPQGGQISVESEINKGSNFSFTLTFLKTKAKIELMHDLLQLDMEMKGINVLVVEDMPLNRLLIKTLLDDFGFKCDMAENGKLALEKLYNNPYDIILMDLQMPKMDGFEATDYIRNSMKLTIPIIALTADVTTVDAGKCKQAGMDDYISKPIDEKLLYSKMVTLIKNAVRTSTTKSLKENAVEKAKCINLAYLNTRTKSNPKMMKEVISIYLEQTPTLIQLMKTSYSTQDWKSLSSVAHKMIPSFSIMGISKDYEEMARKVQEFANSQLFSEEMEEMLMRLETICGQACKELQEELKRLG